MNSIQHNTFSPRSKPTTYQIIDRIWKIISPIFGVFDGLFMTGYGILEIFFSGVQLQKEATKKVNLVTSWFQKKLNHFKKISAEYNIMHGALFTASGIAEVITHATGLAVFEIISSSLFIFANIINLDHNVKRYHHATLLEKKGSPQQKKLIRVLKKSAVIGIISCLAYVLSTSIALFGGPIALILVFCFIGITTGCIKIIYDYLQERKYKKEYGQII